MATAMTSVDRSTQTDDAESLDQWTFSADLLELKEKILVNVDEIVDYLHAHKVLSGDLKDAILTHGNAFQRASCLLGSILLLLPGTEAIEVLCEAARGCGQGGATADVTPSRGLYSHSQEVTVGFLEDSHCMNNEGRGEEEEEEEDLIKRNYTTLSQVISAAIHPVTAYLFQRSVLGNDTKAQILLPTMTASQQAHKLLDLVRVSGPLAYEALYEATLQQCLWKAADLLRPENGPHFPRDEPSSGQVELDFASDSPSNPGTGQDLPSSPGVDLDLVIVGTDRSGKSATANNIFGLDILGSSMTSARDHESCVMGQNRVDGRHITIVEIPGLRQSEMTQVKDHRKKANFYKDAFHLCPDGFHAILIVLPFRLVKMTMKDLDDIHMMCDAIGDVCLRKYGVLVITGGHILCGGRWSQGAFQEWCQSQKQHLKNVFERCGNRVVLFDNKSTKEETLKCQRLKLIKLVDQIRSRDKQYTSVELLLAEKDLSPRSRADLSVLLVGIYGHGKSASGNIILGKQVFETSQEVYNGIGECVVERASVDGRDITVVDTPALRLRIADIDTLYRQMWKLYDKAFVTCPGGFSAILLVLEATVKTTRVNKTAMRRIERVFGRKAFQKHGVVVFTGGDILKASFGDRTMFPEWCETRTGLTQEIIEKCQNRCVLFNNVTEDEEESYYQRQALIEILDSVESRYTFQDFLDARSARRPSTDEEGDEKRT